jgi:dTDP-4-amino-4,6-dideoxygalactose transaminase
MYSNHGRKDHYSYEDVGFNSRMDTFQAAFLNLSLEYLPDRIKARVNAVAQYNDILSTNGITQIVAPRNFKENGYCNVCLVPEEHKKAIQARFTEAGIGFGNIYPSAMSEQECSPKYQNAKFGGDNSILLGKTVFNLPLFPYMAKEEVDTSAQLLIDTINSL